MKPKITNIHRQLDITKRKVTIGPPMAKEIGTATKALAKALPRSCSGNQSLTVRATAGKFGPSPKPKQNRAI